MKQKPTLALLVLLVSLMASQTFVAYTTQPIKNGSVASQQTQNLRDPKPGESGHPVPRPAQTSQNARDCGCINRSSDINPPEPICSDSIFFADCDAGLDTGCTFRNGGPLIFHIKVDRVAGNLQRLKSKGLIEATATLDMPAFDVDFNGGGNGVNPERDRVSFNGHVVPEEFLRGDSDVWRLNTFRIPIEWINFPPDPGDGGTVSPADNVVRIDIDTANSSETWCTSIDWATLRIKVARPVVFAHGIFSGPGTWNEGFGWTRKLDDLGLPYMALDLGFTPNLIQTNAGQIAQKVEQARHRWGVDKVNLVCHSKGGLDARHFVENNDSVEQVIQIGTPNAGSPLADLIIRGSLRLPPLAAIGINLLGLATSPGGYQLTEEYMALYNLTHDHNPKVKYTALAGRYSFGCETFICRILERFIEFGLGGPGDLVVPVSSVHALNYTNNLLFETSGSNRESVHIFQTGSEALFNRLSSRVQAFGTSGSRPAVASSTATSSFAPTASTAATIRQGQVKTHTIAIDQSGPAFFTLMYPSGNLDMALTSPSGQRFDPKNILGNPNVARDDQEILGGRLEVYAFANPEVGNWTVEVSAPLVTEPSGEVAYAISGWIENPAITFTGTAQKLNIHAGETLRVIGTVKNGVAPITGALVTARVLLPNNTTQDLTLRDDGMNGDVSASDGIYTSNFTSTAQAGTYRILYTASRNAGSGVPAFSREDMALATVSSSTSVFSGGFRDFGKDTDGDGLFNSLVVDADLNISQTGNYRVFGILTDSSGNAYQANSQANLNAGIRTVSLEFDGEAIFRNRVNGPYSLTSVRLIEENAGDIMPVDERTNAHQTAPYNFRAFEHGPLTLTGTGNSVGIDTNGNGLFDLLKVSVDIEVVTAGFYNWTAQLTDSNGKDIGFATNSGQLNAGLNTIDLTYNGEVIGQNGVNGPYFLTGLLVVGAGNSLVATDAFTTAPFLVSQFEGSFSICIQDDSNGNILLINPTNGAYQFFDCRKGVSLTGRGKMIISSCKIGLTDTGPDPKRPDRNMSVLVNPCTRVANASIRIASTGITYTIADSNTGNNTCSCGVPR